MAHLKGGGGVTYDLFRLDHLGISGIPIDPDGANQLFNDGSARWVDFEDMTPVWNLAIARQFWLYQ